MARYEVMEKCQHEPVRQAYMANTKEEPRCRHCGARYVLSEVEKPKASTWPKKRPPWRKPKTS